MSNKVVKRKNRKTIPASEVGLTLTISDKALREIENIQEQQIKDILNAPKIFFR